jgi:hypothetical protein
MARKILKRIHALARTTSKYTGIIDSFQDHLGGNSAYLLFYFNQLDNTKEMQDWHHTQIDLSVTSVEQKRCKGCC